MNLALDLLTLSDMLAVEEAHAIRTPKVARADLLRSHFHDFMVGKIEYPERATVKIGEG
jgi:hypothetical protein